MPTEFVITAPEIGTAGTCEQERIGRSRRAGTNADTAFVVLQFIVDIFEADREVLADLLLDAAAAAKAPGITAVSRGEAVRRIAGRKAVLDLAIHRAAGCVEQCRAHWCRRKADTTADAGGVIELARHRVARRCRAEGRHTVADFGTTEFAHYTDNDGAHMSVGTHTTIIFDAVLVIGAVFVGRTGSAATTKSCREGVGILRRDDGVAERTVEITVKQD